MTKQIVLDTKANSVFPHPKVLEAYADPKRGNNFQRIRTAEDDIYEGFVNRCRKNPFYLEAVRAIRTRTFVGGKLAEILYYYGQVTGEASTGIQETWYYWVGFYDEPQFQRVLDKEKEDYVVTGVRNKIRRYEFLYTPDLIDNLREDGIIVDMTALSIRETPETNTAYDILLYEDFRDASFLQLLEIGKTKKSLNEVRKVIPDEPTKPVQQVKVDEEDHFTAAIAVESSNPEVQQERPHPTPPTPKKKQVI